LALVFQLGWAYPRVLAMLAVAGAALLGLVWLADGGFIAHLWHSQVARGDSRRMLLWQLSWVDIQPAFWLGHGPGHRLFVEGHSEESFPHNLFLSTWLYAGLIGLGLLLAYLALVTLRAFAAPSRAERALRLSLVINMVICGMTDFGQLIKGPSPLWYLIWLPTIFAATLETKKRG
jgi:O-antigen ligase